MFHCNPSFKQNSIKLMHKRFPSLKKAKTQTSAKIDPIFLPKKLLVHDIQTPDSKGLQSSERNQLLCLAIPLYSPDFTTMDHFLKLKKHIK